MRKWLSILLAVFALVAIVPAGAQSLHFFKQTKIVRIELVEMGQARGRHYVIRNLAAGRFTVAGRAFIFQPQMREANVVALTISEGSSQSLRKLSELKLRTGELVDSQTSPAFRVRLVKIYEDQG